MRQRTTVLLPQGTGVDPRNIELSPSSILLNAADGLVEERGTWILDDLPEELIDILKRSHELHIRWSSRYNSPHAGPLVSRLPAGLHIFYTPLEGQVNTGLCHSLQAVFGSSLKCTSAAESFTRPPILSERFAHAATYQHYQPLTDLASFSAYLSSEICLAVPTALKQSCKKYADAFSSARTLDIDFDTISHAVTVTATWLVKDAPNASKQQKSVQLNVERPSEQDRVEVGILSAETPDEPEELKLGGYLAVIGEDKKPGATMFSFPSRHHPLPQGIATTFNATLARPTGLHPNLLLDFARASIEPPKDACKLHAYLTLPSSLFIDRYQLSDPTLLAESNLVALHALSGAEDLEAPDWTVEQWGSAALFELALPSAKDADKSIWQIILPLHLRYLRAELEGVSSYRDIGIPTPIAFWACEAEEGLKMATNPFDRVNIGYDGLFGPKTMFYHIPAAQSSLMLDLTVPVLRPEHGQTLQLLTLATVALGFGWILLLLFKPIQHTSKTHVKKA